MPKGNAFAFDRANPAAVAWAQGHAADTISGISKTTREDIADLVEEAMSGEFDVATLASEITSLLGDSTRAELIARTETATAANEGLMALWDQAVTNGYLKPTSKKEWIVTPDDKLCPICEPLDGEQVGLDEEFDVDGELMDGPPAHPNCRCVVALVV